MPVLDTFEAVITYRYPNAVDVETRELRRLGAQSRAALREELASALLTLASLQLEQKAAIKNARRRHISFEADRQAFNCARWQSARIASPPE